jgi:hypothetical protein
VIDTVKYGPWALIAGGSEGSAPNSPGFSPRRVCTWCWLRARWTHWSRRPTSAVDTAAKSANAWGGGSLGRVENKTDQQLSEGIAVAYYGPFWAMRAPRRTCGHAAGDGSSTSAA